MRGWGRLAFFGVVSIAVAAVRPGTGLAAETPGPAAAVATVNGDDITLRELKDFIEAGKNRKSGEALSEPAAVLEKIIEGRLLFQEAQRKGLGNDPAHRSRLGSYRRQALLRQYVLWKYGDEIRVTEEEARTKPRMGFHNSGRSTPAQWARMMTSTALKNKIKTLINGNKKEADITYLSDVYQSENGSGQPFEELVVARIDGREVRWSQVTERMKKHERSKPPPLQGMDALRFVRAISKLAGEISLLAEAEEHLPQFREEVDREVGQFEYLLLTQRLLRQEVDAKGKVSEEETRRYFEDHREAYLDGEGQPLTFKTVRARAIKDAQRRRQEEIRREMAAALRAGAAIKIHREILGTLKP